MDILQALDEAVAYTDPIMKSVRRDQALLQTPCENWLVFEVQEHMAELMPHFANAAWHEPPPGEWQKPSDLVDTWHMDTMRAMEGWRREGALEKSVQTSFGMYAARRAAERMLVETAVHGWDLATATEQEREMSDELAAATREAAEAMIEHVFNGQRDPKQFGPEVTPAEGASETDKLVAFLGRTP